MIDKEVGEGLLWTAIEPGSGHVNPISFKVKFCFHWFLWHCKCSR
jgi:hypothetical protein